jgi:hypothetical protein
MRRVALDVGSVVVNLLAHVVGFSVLGLHGAYALLFEAMDLGRAASGSSPRLTQAHALVVAACVGATIVGGVSELWSRKALFTALPATLAYLVGVTMLAMSMFMVDKGDPSIMWQYVLPRWSDVLPAFIVGFAAALGWHAARRYHDSRRAKAVSSAERA